MILTPAHLHDYQKRAINHQLSHPRSMLWIGMGLGKTVITETSIAHLLQYRAIRASLVLGPLRVVQSVWAQEAKKWSHLRHLRFNLIHGSPQERMRALFRPADIYLMNYENLGWLSTQLKHYFINQGTLLPFDLLALDESTKVKNHETKRMEAIIPLLPYFTYRTGLTGTPASNGLEDLFGQYLVIDDGERLGKSPSFYLGNYFRKAGQNGYKYKVTPEGENYIHQAVADITLEMKSEDYIELPDFVTNDIYVELSPKHRKQYDELELLMFTELDNGEPLEVNAPAAKTNKCLQFSNGAAFTNTETREWHPVHDKKLDALEDILEEAGGSPVLVAYNYTPDAIRILERFPFAKNLTGMKGSEFLQTLEDWKDGKIRMLLGHPASMGHGVDGLQKSGHTLVWFGLNWSLELTLQFNARLQRQGQGHPVICHRILTKDTLDDAVRVALDVKTQTQEDLRAAVDQYRRAKWG